jgi:DNA-binding transcriptional LysR family regulator
MSKKPQHGTKSIDDLQAFSRLPACKASSRPPLNPNVSPSALSHTMRGLEERLGVRLLNRTTRSVAPTVAGAQLLARLSPALLDIQSALDNQRLRYRRHPAYYAPRAASELVLRHW